MQAAEKHGGSLRDATQFLHELLAQYDKVAVTGRPGIGKSAVVDKLSFGWWTGGNTLRTDAYKHLPWGQQPQAAIDWTRSRVGWLMEGVTVARALRHGLGARAVLILTGTPLRPQHNLAAMRLGDSVYDWVAEARDSGALAAFHYWRVAEPKRC